MDAAACPQALMRSKTRSAQCFRESDTTSNLPESHSQELFEGEKAEGEKMTVSWHWCGNHILNGRFKRDLIFQVIKNVKVVGLSDSAGTSRSTESLSV